MLKVQILAIIILLYCLFSPPPLNLPVLYKVYVYIIYDLLFFLSYQIYFYIKSIQNELVDKINEIHLNYINGGEIYVLRSKKY